MYRVGFSQVTGANHCILQACTGQDITRSGKRCSCPFEEGMLMQSDFADVDGLPFSAMFDVPDLRPFTEYCVQGVGLYTSETAAGIGQILRTSSELL